MPYQVLLQEVPKDFILRSALLKKCNLALRFHGVNKILQCTQSNHSNNSDISHKAQSPLHCVESVCPFPWLWMNLLLHYLLFPNAWGIRYGSKHSSKPDALTVPVLTSSRDFRVATQRYSFCATACSLPWILSTTYAKFTTNWIYQSSVQFMIYCAMKNRF